MTFAALVCIAVQLPFLDHLGITLTSLQGFRTSVPARLLALTFVVEGKYCIVVTWVGARENVRVGRRKKE